MTKRRIWIVCGAAAVVAVAFFLAREPGLSVAVATVGRGQIQAVVEEQGKTALSRVVEISMPLSGCVESVDVAPGTAVAAGAVVARLDPADLDAALAAARAELDRTAAQLAVSRNLTLENTALREAGLWREALAKTVASAEEVVKASEAQKQFSGWWLAAVQKLTGQGAVADEKLRRAQLDDAESLVNLATSRLGGSIAWTIKTAFDLGPDYIKQFIALQEQRAAMLEAERTTARIRLDQALRDRARAEIVSPVNGVVLARHQESRRVLPAGAPLLTVGDPNTLEVQADVLSQEAARIHPGDPAEIFGQAVGELSLPARVDRIEPQAVTKVSSLGVEQQRVRIVLRFPPEALDKLRASGRTLGIGYGVRVRVVTATAADALVIPRLALFPGNDGAWRCFAVRDGRARETDVAVGLLNENQAQVLDGLHAGDAVVVGPPKELANGAAVRAVGKR
jgi:HlyD family secretion protein